MSDAQATGAVTLVNRRRQPIELHLAGEVRVLLPDARTQLDAASVALPQIRHLIKHKLLSIAPTSTAPHDEDAAAYALAEPGQQKTSVEAVDAVGAPQSSTDASETPAVHARNTQSRRASSEAGQPATLSASVKPDKDR